MFCKNCGAQIADDAKFCPSCGTKVELNGTPSKQINEGNADQKAIGSTKKKRGCGCYIAIFIALIFAGSLIYSLGMAMQGGSTGYASIDRSQSSESRCDAIAEAMDDALEELGYYPVDYSVEWIGYSKYRDQYSEDEYEQMQLGGYYTYMSTLSTGEVANARISTYWRDTEQPVLLDLNIETATSEKVIVEYSEEKILNCWNTYFTKAHPAS